MGQTYFCTGDFRHRPARSHRLVLVVVSTFKPKGKSESRNQEEAAADCDQVFQQRNHKIRQRFLHQARPCSISCECSRHSPYSSQYRSDRSRAAGRPTECRSAKSAQNDAPKQGSRGGPAGYEGQLVGDEFAKREGRKRICGRRRSHERQARTLKMKPAQVGRPTNHCWASQRTQAGNQSNPKRQQEDQVGIHAKLLTVPIGVGIVCSMRDFVEYGVRTGSHPGRNRW